MSNKNKALLYSIIGLGLEFISLFVFGFLSLIGLILGIMGLSSSFKGKRLNENTLAPLIISSLTIAFGAVGFIFYLISVIIQFQQIGILK